MTRRTRIALLAVLAVVVLAAAWVAGSRGGGDASGSGVGSVRLGPDPGQSLTEYRAGLAAALPPPGQTTLALVQVDAQLDVRAAAALAGSTPVVTAVFRVPLPRVQTALRFEPVTGTGDLVAALDVARSRAGFAADADATRLVGRARDVAAAERRGYADPACTCVLALVVQADRARLETLAGTSGVRGVQAAPVGARARDLALSPMLPEQRVSADPLPDDGPVPTA